MALISYWGIKDFIAAKHRNKARFEREETKIGILYQRED